VILAGFALLLVRSIKRRAATVMIACVLCVGYWVALRWSQVAMSGGYPVVLSAWLPNLVVLDFCLLAGALAAHRRFSRLTDSG
jgi:lipopolysaccharide export LptBFGC system permease protein LptF